ncbi:hypothetical protein SGI36_21480, partial [Providencia rettgeri]
CRRTRVRWRGELGLQDEKRNTKDRGEESLYLFFLYFFFVLSVLQNNPNVVFPFLYSLISVYRTHCNEKIKEKKKDVASIYVVRPR